MGSAVGQESRSANPALGLIDALRVLAELRRDEIVVTAMGAAREWPKLSRHELDFTYVPSAMGNAPALGLGLALAQPDRKVLVLNGDGSTLMSLGCLVTLAAAAPPNLTLVILNNGIYEVTGGQGTAAAAAGIDWLALVRGAGIASVRRFSDLVSWRAEAAETLRLPGPRVVILDVAPVGDDYQLDSPGPMAARIARFRQALGGT